MALIQLTHDPILSSNAQVLILPVNNAGSLLDPVLARTKTLYSDNYQLYYQGCRDGSLLVGSCLLHKRALEMTGLSARSNGNYPSYIANLVVSNHPYHPPREQWLNTALADLQQQLLMPIRYKGVRTLALLARPLLYHNPASIEAGGSVSEEVDGQINNEIGANVSSRVPLDWQSVTLPLIIKHLEKLPKVRIELHLPKSVAI